MKIYTRKGDQGLTTIISGKNLMKDSPTIEAIGNLDELNAQIGYLRDLIIQANVSDDFMLKEIQDNLFTLSAIMVGSKIDNISQDDIDTLEKKIDALTEKLPPLKNFILSGGHPVVSWCQVVRTTTRRAERSCVSFLTNKPPLTMAYLNRLSDYFFTLARYLAKQLGVTEVIWSGR